MFKCAILKGMKKFITLVITNKPDVIKAIAKKNHRGGGVEMEITQENNWDINEEELGAWLKWAEKSIREFH